jgi:hypothetical protein
MTSVLPLDETEIELTLAPKLLEELPLSAEPCNAGPDCTGEKWTSASDDQLSRLIAIIAMGQASQAAHILSELEEAVPAFTTAELRHEAKVTLTVQDKKQTPRTGYPRWQRDGFMFEAISWIAARQAHGPSVQMKDPHVSSTSQGIDGLMLELPHGRVDIDRVTIFEDKCTDDPGAMFNGKVIPAFLDRHSNRRSAEVVAAATVLLRMAGIGAGDAARLAAAVTDRSKRRYRAAFAVTTVEDSDEVRQELFKRYVEIEGITKEQRLAACLIVPPKLRDWFDQLAASAVAFVDELDEHDTNV